MKGNKIAIESDKKVIWNIDGDRGDSGNALIECLARHITIMTPQKAVDAHLQ